MNTCYETPYGTFSNQLDFLNFCIDNNKEYNLNLTRFQFSKKFEIYDFKKNLKTNWIELAEQRFSELRKKYDHIRFWYSGGKDSRFVLNLAEHLNFKFDELIFLDNTIFENPEAKNLFVPQHYISNKKFLHLKLDHTIFHDFFSNKDWFKKSLDYSITAPMWTGNVIQLNEKHNFFCTIPNTVNLLGGLTPIIWYDKYWNFIFTNDQFTMHIAPSTESFLFSENLPEMYNLYVSNIIESMETQNFYYNFEQTVNFLKNNSCNCNYFRDLVLEFKNMPTQYQFPKKNKNNSANNNHIWQNYNNRPKDKLTIKFLKKTFPKIFNSYVNNTNWKIVKQLSSVFTKKFEIKDK